MSNQQSVFHSNIAFDLGGRYTGVFLVNHAGGETPTADKTLAATIVMPQDGEHFSYSTKARTAVRHRVRAGKRYKLVRRLIDQVVNYLEKQKGCTVAEEERRRRAQALSSLLRRRGYSRLEGETDADLSPLERIDASVFAEHPDLGEFFEASRTIAEQWDEISQKPAVVRKLLNALPTVKEIADYIKSDFKELAEQKKDYQDAVKVLTEDAKSIDLQINLGHKHRSEYFKAIQKDMQRDVRLRPLFDLFGSQERINCQNIFPHLLTPQRNPGKCDTQRNLGTRSCPDCWPRSSV